MINLEQAPIPEGGDEEQEGGKENQEDELETVGSRGKKYRNGEGVEQTLGRLSDELSEEAIRSMRDKGEGENDQEDDEDV